MAELCGHTRDNNSELINAMRTINTHLSKRTGIVASALVDSDKTITVDLRVLLKPAEAAKAIGLSKKTLASWRSSGLNDLKHVRIGSRILYRQCDVEAFVQSRIRKSTSDQGGCDAHQ